MIARGNVANVYIRRTLRERCVFACGASHQCEDAAMASAMADEVETVKFLGVKDAESVILCSRFHIHNLFDRGVLRGHRIGRNRRIRVDSIREYIGDDEYRLGLLESKLSQIAAQKQK